MNKYLYTKPMKQNFVLYRSENRPITNVRHLIKEHSPSGFEWGYSGSGPTDLALNILILFVSYPIAYQLAPLFRDEFIARLPEEGGTIPVEDVIAFLDIHIDTLDIVGHEEE